MIKNKSSHKKKDATKNQKWEWLESQRPEPDIKNQFSPSAFFAFFASLRELFL